MNLEDLTKQQIVLLGLLISFVSAVATGIVIVSIADQSPQPVTQTINRVIERTIEKTVASPTGPVVTKETVVVSEDDAVVKAIETVSKNIIRISAFGSEFLGIGAQVSADGVVIARVPLDNSLTYEGLTSLGTKVSLSVIGSDTQNGLVMFRIQNPTAKEFVKLMDSDNIKLGQKVVSITGESTDTVATGIVSQLDRGVGNRNSLVNKSSNRIRTSINNTEALTHSVLINLSGELVGLKIGADSGDGYVPSNTISKLISSVSTQ